ncbi:hypothetical protein NDU88_004520 [Pleurodeles waltl]|uniref:Uncharacterized protein n=1 Tax=Pleurodeles waltl TaxID=8319 RepID=A0AAV7TSN6_PLEWA|nr:hypothetical protein NDU88_004520 [Pleurodeles waltl]
MAASVLWPVRGMESGDMDMACYSVGCVRLVLMSEVCCWKALMCGQYGVRSGALAVSGCAWSLEGQKAPVVLASARDWALLYISTVFLLWVFVLASDLKMVILQFLQFIG